MYPTLNLFGKEINTMIVVYSLGGLVAALSFVLKRKQYNFSLKKALLYTVILIGAGMIELKIMGEIRNLSMTLISGGEYSPGGSVRIFGAILFQPILCYIVSLITGDKFRVLIDSITPETFLYFIFGKISCSLEGCCFGIPYENGVTTVKYDDLVFPVQICEAVSTAIVVLLLYLLMVKKDKLRIGSLFPIGTILYSAIRFYWENYRYYDMVWERDFLLGMTYWQVWCVVSIVVSVLWLIVLYTKNDDSESSIEKKEKALVPRLEAYAINKKERNRVHHTAKDKKRNKKKK